MGQDFTTPPQQELFISFSSSFPVKDRIIAGKTEDPHPMYKGYLPEHKIPERIGIEIFQCDPEEAICCTDGEEAICDPDTCTWHCP